MLFTLVFGLIVWVTGPYPLDGTANSSVTSPPAGSTAPGPYQPAPPAPNGPGYPTNGGK
jgi:hypothetical protein